MMTMKDNRDFSLRPATLDDISEILKIEIQSQVRPWSEENFLAEFSKPYSYFFVLTDDESDSILAGFLVAWVMFDECQILNLVVGESFRRAGFASLMIRKCIQLASQKGIKKVVLEVRKSNFPAIQLYQSLRFVIFCVRKGFYSNGEDAYQMILSLDSNLDF